jgi:hypothetical protein
VSAPGRAQKIYLIDGVGYTIHQIRARLSHVPHKRIERRLRRGWRTWAQLGAARMANGGPNGTPWAIFSADAPYFASKATIAKRAVEREQ